jgi:hypothetical protein
MIECGCPEQYKSYINPSYCAICGIVFLVVGEQTGSLLRLVRPRGGGKS